MEGVDFTPTEQGTPQGGVISPLLANVALHGMEQSNHRRISQESCGRKTDTRRYADDFVILHSDKVELQKVAERVATWLQGMGLQLSPSKTRIDSHVGLV